MNCTKCGAPMPPNQVFCASCGTPVQQLPGTAPEAPGKAKKTLFWSPGAASPPGAPVPEAAPAPVAAPAQPASTSAHAPTMIAGPGMVPNFPQAAPPAPQAPAAFAPPAPQSYEAAPGMPPSSSRYATLTVMHAEKQSRGLLLLRTLFGFLYVGIPHGICLLFFGIWAMLASLIAWFAILFTGRYPKVFFNAVVGMTRWQMRVSAYMLFLTDKYPAFGPGEQPGDTVLVSVPYPESLSRLMLLLKTFFGFIYLLIPHGFCLMFRFFALYFVILIAWFAILFTGRYPAGLHRFATGTLRWQLRVGQYMYQSDAYPPFSGKE